MKWLVDGYILNVHFVYDALSDTLVFDGNSNSIGLTGDKSRACDVVKEKVFCGTEYVRDVTISNSMQNYIKVQGKKPFKDIESNINAWFAYIKKKYQIELNGRYDKSFDKIVDIEDFFRNLMFFCFEFKISGCINDGWNEELKFVDKGLSLR